MAVARAISGSLSVKDRWILAAFGTTAAGLSLAGSAFIVLCYILFKELRKFSFKLVFFLALSDMLCSFFSLVGEPSNGLFCYAQDYSAHFFCIASFLWTTTIAFTLHRTVVKHKTDVEDFGSIFHLYVWGTSFAMTVIRSIGSDYGPIGAWCWTGSGKKEKVVHLITFYTPLWGAILYNGFTYYQVNRMLSNATRMAVGISDSSYRFDSGAGRKALNKWGYYPLILIGSWAFATINRIFDFLHPDHKIFWLSLADVWFAGLMGLFNSIAYGLNSSVRQAIAERLDIYLPEKFKRLFPQARKSQQQDQELASLMVES
ncbi:G-protein coupled receptor 1 isoform X1 [Phalaenopsis equestris]|uniref:G-protein coupled receptor 1 isoform X1 n=1 Tax=Phalaenopsis equestris TaxID=78828 RepID=UPI0009E49B06|nr:G-protein coupled receptor 1 isoform X1 [Phalaenopsis equestris]